jgi:flagellar transcriptional activator FlhD
VASIIEALTPSQMIKVASGNTLMCRFRFDEEMIWSLLADHGRRGEGDDGNASRLHASILMAGKFSGGRLTWPPAAFSKTAARSSARSN